MDPKVSKLASLLGSASLLAMAASSVSQAQQMAQAQMAEVPEQVLITGSLIRGTVAVGVPVTNIGPQDFIQTGALTTADLFKTIPAFVVTPGAVGRTMVAILAGRIPSISAVLIRSADTPSALC
jgi:hypothetical protein